jgi:DNA-binding transcriptional regulator YiaG
VKKSCDPGKGNVLLQSKNMTQAKQNKMGCAIRNRRKALGLSLKDLALRAQTTQGAVSHIERGIRKPSAEMLARLASGLDCSVDDLLTGVVVEVKEGRYVSRILNDIKTLPPSVQKQVADYCRFLRYQNREKSK